MKNAQKLMSKIGMVTVLLVGLTSCGDHDTDATVKAEEVDKIIIPNDQAKELYDTYTIRREGLIRDFENAQDSLGNQGASDDHDQKRQNKEDGSQKAVQQSNDQQNDTGFQVVRYGFSDFQSLKKYMTFIEQEAERANVNISTLRFYFANYPDKDKFNNGNPVKEPRRNTLVFVPTVNTGKGEYAFYTADDDDGLRKAFLLSEELADNGQSFGGKGKEEASMLPTANLSNTTEAPLPVTNKQSLSGNEWGLRPPQ